MEEILKHSFVSTVPGQSHRFLSRPIAYLRRGGGRLDFKFFENKATSKNVTLFTQFLSFLTFSHHRHFYIRVVSLYTISVHSHRNLRQPSVVIIAFFVFLDSFNYFWSIRLVYFFFETRGYAVCTQIRFVQNVHETSVVWTHNLDSIYLLIFTVFFIFDSINIALYYGTRIVLPLTMYIV